MGEIRDNLKKNLNYYLDIMNISQKTLSEKLNVSQAAVTNWVKGKNSPDIETVSEICEILNVKISDLLGEKDIQYKDVLSLDEKNILLKYSKLNELGKERLNERLDELLELPKYQKGIKLRKISEILNDHAYIAADEGGVEEIERDPNLPKISDLIDD